MSVEVQGGGRWLGVKHHGVGVVRDGRVNNRVVDSGWLVHHDNLLRDHRDGRLGWLLAFLNLSSVIGYFLFCLHLSFSVLSVAALLLNYLSVRLAAGLTALFYSLVISLVFFATAIT